MEVGAIGCFLAGMVFASASVGAIAGVAFSKWKKLQRSGGGLPVAAAFLRGLKSLPTSPLGLLLPAGPCGIDAIAVDFETLAHALERGHFFFQSVAVPSAAPPGGWNADDVGNGWRQ